MTSPIQAAAPFSLTGKIFGTQFTCFTRTIVQMLTPEEILRHVTMESLRLAIGVVPQDAGTKVQILAHFLVQK
jgi:hypothetical protein